MQNYTDIINIVSNRKLPSIIRWALWSPADWLYQHGPDATFSLPVSWPLFISVALLIVAFHFIPIPDWEIYPPPILIVEILSCILSLLVLKMILRQQKLTFQAIGFSRQHSTQEFLIGLGVFLLLAVGQITYNSFWGSPPQPLWMATFDYTQVEWILRVTAQALAVGISEEAIFRGWILTFLLTRLASREHALWSTAIIFGLVHINQGLHVAVGATAFGYLFGLLYIWRKNLTAAIVIHTLQNLFVWLDLLGRS